MQALCWVLGLHSLVLSLHGFLGVMLFYPHLRGKDRYSSKPMCCTNRHLSENRVWLPCTHTTETEPRKTFGGGGLTLPSGITGVFSSSSVKGPDKQACVCKGGRIEIKRVHGTSFSPAESLRKHSKMTLFCIHYKVCSCAGRKPMTWRRVGGRGLLSCPPSTESQSSRSLSCPRTNRK